MAKRSVAAMIHAEDEAEDTDDLDDCFGISVDLIDERLYLG